MTPNSSFSRTAIDAFHDVFRLAGALGVALLLTACASMSEKECLSANWTDQGYRDGRDGQPLSRLEDHRQACSRVGVAPDTSQYLAGREVGIGEYCTPANAVREGRLGRGYRNACPMQLERNFLSYHELGHQAYQAEQRVESLNREMQRRQRELDKEKNDAKRKALRRELRRLNSRLAQARRELYDEEQSLRRIAPTYHLVR